VTARPFPSNRKKVVFPTKLDGAILDPNDSTCCLLKSPLSGYIERRVLVDPVYTVKDVDLHTGNILYREQYT